jgi:hypothetical protein
MARWRTSAAAAAIVLVATACGNAEPSRDTGATATLPSNAKLAPAGQKPLKVRGTGFLPDEHVRVATEGKTVITVADSQGSFVVSMPGVNSCKSATVKATGADGSHAEFNLSHVACNGS